jgi:hypothetical protein
VKNKIASIMTLLLVAGTIQVLAATAASAATLDVNYGLAGCDLGTATAYDQTTATCTQDGYGNGNLGKEWNELDLVPFQVSLTNNTNTTKSGTFVLAGDYIKAAGDEALGKFGWDFVSTLTLNTDESDAGCPPNPTESAVTITPTGGDIGGADRTIYRSVTTSVPANTTCVYDYYMRLAIGSHTFSGSNLQGYVLNENLGSQTVGQHKRSIPVNEILPQELSKSMTATQDQQQEWILSKEATPTAKDFGNTCLEGNNDPTQEVQITITWTKGDVVADGQVAVHTEVTATNPAHRDIQVDVTDVIYSGDSSDPLNELDSKTEGEIVEAETEEVVLTHDLLLDEADAVDLNDVATATYTDVIANVEVPGQTTAKANATIVPSGTINNGTVDITDSESITGAGLSFSVDSALDASDQPIGQFIGYTLGDSVDENGGPVLWHLLGATDSGQVTFTKTVTFDGPGDASGTLSDEANMSVDGDPIVDAKTASTTFTSSTIATLTINKKTSVPVDAPGADFAFDVYTDSGIPDDPDTDNVDESLGTLVDDVIVHIDALGTSGSGTLGGLNDGDYIIVETDAAGFTPADNTPFTVGAGVCDVPVEIQNTFGPATARVKKITVPAGSEDGWTFNLYLDDNAGPNGEDTPYSTVTTTDADFISFPAALVDEGDYYVLEEEQHGWTSDGGDTGCTFTVDYPLDADQVFSCTFTNTKQTASASVAKVTDPVGNEDGWTFDLYLDNDPVGTAGPEDTLLSTVVTGGTGQTQFLDASNNPIELDEGDYYIVETPQDGWESDGGSADCTFTVAFPASDGITYECTFTNTARGTIKVTKTVSGSGTFSGSFSVELRQGAADTDPGTGDDTPGDLLDTQPVTSANQPVQLNGDLEPGTYQVCELVPGPGWIVTFDGSPADFELQLNDSNERQCVNVEVGVDAADQDITVAVDNTPPPGGGQLTIGFWKNHASCKTSSGKQSPVLDDVLKTFPIAPNQTKPGFYVGTLYVDTCQEAVSLLNKQAVGTVGKGQKKASDAFFNLASQYVAAVLNVQGGASTCNGQATTLINTAQALMQAVGFNGAGTTVTPTSAQTSQALSLAGLLDQYNNGLLC